MLLQYQYRPYLILEQNCEWIVLSPVSSLPELRLGEILYEHGLYYSLICNYNTAMYNAKESREYTFQKRSLDLKTHVIHKQKWHERVGEKQTFQLRNAECFLTFLDVQKPKFTCSFMQETK